MENINNYNKEFKEFLIKRCKSNLRFISKIRFNKKSISVTINDYEHLVFNDFFNKKYLYNTILSYLIIFIKENNIDFPIDKDFLEYKFPKMNIKVKLE